MVDPSLLMMQLIAYSYVWSDNTQSCNVHFANRSLACSVKCNCQDVKR